MTTPDLFSPQPRARNSDPDTSHAAAQRMRGKACHNHYALILGVLWRPMTGKTIAKLVGLSMEQVCRRLPELEQMGKVRPTGDVEDGCRVWSLDKGVDAGRHL